MISSHDIKKIAVVSASTLELAIGRGMRRAASPEVQARPGGDFAPEIPKFP